MFAWRAPVFPYLTKVLTPIVCWCMVSQFPTLSLQESAWSRLIEPEPPQTEEAELAAAARSLVAINQPGAFPSTSAAVAATTSAAGTVQYTPQQPGGGGGAPERRQQHTIVKTTSPRKQVRTFVVAVVWLAPRSNLLESFR